MPSAKEAIREALGYCDVRPSDEEIDAAVEAAFAAVADDAGPSAIWNALDAEIEALIGRYRWRGA